MSYKLDFLQEALKEWGSLDTSIKNKFKKKLAERIVEPRLEVSRLSGVKDFYKIKLRSAGFRLLYEVLDELVVIVITVGKRERNAVYKIAARRS